MSRLIDADKLRDDVLNFPDCYNGFSDTYDKAWIVDAIDAQPTAEPQERTGKWLDAVIPNDNGGLPVQVCDQCNTFFPLAYTGGGHHYCPNCGARMEVDNETD